MNSQLSMDDAFSQITYNSISWGSTVDGPGLRLVLYLQGCLLNCPWCHSPHSIPIKYIPILFFPDLCQTLGQCVDACPRKLHTLEEKKHHYNRAECLSCGACAEACSDNRESNIAALRTAAVQIELSELWKKIKPQLMLLRSNGGLTISGGEPLLQGNVLPELLDLCKNENINTALETSGFIPDMHLSLLAQRVDTWLFGLRPNSCYSNQVSERILSNLGQLVKSVGAGRIIIRTPLVPEVVEHVGWKTKLCSILKRYGLQRIEFLPLNPNTDFYYLAMGKDAPGYGPMKAGIAEDAVQYFSSRGFSARLVTEA